MIMLSIWHYSFIQNAFLAGTLIAIIAGVMGYFLISRGLTFASHALAHVGFAGATGALVAGFDPLLGMLGATICAALGLSLLGTRLNERDVATGVIMTFLLGLGALFLSLYHGYAESAYSVLFGNVLAIKPQDVVVTCVFSLSLLLVIAGLFRPLVFCSFDAHVAAAKGVPVRWISVFFLVLVAIAVSMSVQIVGILLIFSLFVGPAASATRLSRTPMRAIGISMILSVIDIWLGLLAAICSGWPVSFCVASLSFGTYALVRLKPRL